MQILRELSDDCPLLDDKEMMLKGLAHESQPDQSRTRQELMQLKSGEGDLVRLRERLLDSLERELSEPEVFAERYERIRGLIHQNRAMQATLQTFRDGLDGRQAALARLPPRRHRSRSLCRHYRAVTPRAELASEIGFTRAPRPEKKVFPAPMAELCTRWAAVQAVKERHPFGVSDPG